VVLRIHLIFLILRLGNILEDAYYIHYVRVMNLLPIPALDGGHVMFLLYKIFSGKKPSG
jgi:hypothetical protein